MQKQSSLDNSELLQKIQILVQSERRIGVEILELLHEIERRKAYSALGYDGLFSYCVKKLRYSEAQAYRRIQAMQALKQNPELKEKIESGRLTVTTVSQVQTYLTQEKRNGEPLAPKQAKDLFQQAENKSAREVELELQERRGVNTNETLRIELDSDLATQWKRVRDLSAHRTQGQDIEILRLMLEAWLGKNDPLRKKAAPSAPDGKTGDEAPSESSPDPRRTSSFLRKSNRTESSDDSTARRRKPIPTAIRREVWRRDKGKCRNCGSTFAIQIDHLQPAAKGGESTADNLRLLCRSCNLAEGARIFGPEAMKRVG